MCIVKSKSGLLLGAFLAATVSATGVFAQSESDSSYLSSLDDMVLDMDLGTVGTETYDTVVVAAPTLAEAVNMQTNVNFAEMDCATLQDWAAENTDSSGILAGADMGGDSYQAAMEACALPTHALALAHPASVPSS